MKALVGAFNQEKALVGAFSVIVQPVVEPMEHYTALLSRPSSTADEGHSGRMLVPSNRVEMQALKPSKEPSPVQMMRLDGDRDT